MCTRVYYYIYIYSYYIYQYAQHQHKQPINFASFGDAPSVSHNTTLHTDYIPATYRLHAPHCSHYICIPFCSRLHAAIPYLYNMRYYILLTYYLLNPKRSTDRFRLFYPICLSFNGLYRGEHPYLPPKPVAQPKNVVIYFSEKIFFEKNSVLPLAFLFLFRTFA